VLISIPIGVLTAVIFPMVYSGFMQQFTPVYHAFHIIMWIGMILVAIYLIRRWSVQWNKTFEMH